MRKGWEIKILGEVCEFNNGDRGTNYPSKSARTIEGIPFINAGHLTDNGLDWINMDYISRTRYNLLGNGKIKKNDILFCLRGSLGKFACVGDLSEGAIASSLVIVRPTSKVLTKYIMAYFSSRMCANMIKFYGNGAAQPNLSAASLKNFLIPIPPLPEQQRIVSILDEAFSSIEQAKENLQRNLQNAKELFQSEMNSIFTNKGEGWEEKPLGEVCDELFAGGDAPKENFSSEKTEFNNIPIYANAVKDKGLYGFTNYARVTKPSITIAARGSGTGHTFLRHENYFPIVRLIVIIPNTKLIDLSFLKLAIDTLVIVRSGSAIPQLTIPMIKNYTIPFPNLETQQKIVQQLDKLSEETKRLEAMYQQKLDNLEELKKSILQKAFSGEFSENLD